MRILKIIAICIFVLLLIAAIGFLSAKYYIKREAFKNFTPQELADFEKWRTEELSIPLEYLEPRVFKQSTIDAAVEYRSQMENYEPKPAELYSSFLNIELPFLPAEGIDNANIRQAELNPLLNAFKNLVSQDDYVLEAIAAGYSSTNRYYMSTATVGFNSTIKLISINSLLLATEGKTIESLEAVRLMFQSSKISAYSSMVERWTVLISHSPAIKIISEIVRDSRDGEHLHIALDILNNAAKNLSCYSPEFPLFVVDQISIIRDMKKFGIDVKLEKCTGKELMEKCILANKKYIEKYHPYELTDIPMFKSYMRKQRVKDFFYYNSFSASDPILYSEWIERNRLYNESIDEMERKLNALRLDIATRLYALEHDGVPPEPSDLVPDYLPEVIGDLFADEGWEAGDIGE